MRCPFCEAMATIGQSPIMMFAGGIGLGALMAANPTKKVPVCGVHMIAAREVALNMEIPLHFVPEGGA